MKNIIKNIIFTSSRKSNDEFAGYELKFAIAVGTVFFIAAISGANFS